MLALKRTTRPKGKGNLDNYVQGSPRVTGVGIGEEDGQNWDVYELERAIWSLPRDPFVWRSCLGALRVVGGRLLLSSPSTDNSPLVVDLVHINSNYYRQSQGSYHLLFKRRYGSIRGR